MAAKKAPTSPTKRATRTSTNSSSNSPVNKTLTKKQIAQQFGKQTANRPAVTRANKAAHAQMRDATLDELRARQRESKELQRKQWWLNSLQEKIAYEARQQAIVKEAGRRDNTSWVAEVGIADLTREVLSAIIGRIYEGLTLNTAAREAGTYAATVMSAMRQHPDLILELARARNTYTRAKIDEMYDIADQEPDVPRAALKINLIKWSASKVFPREYGDSLTLKGDEDNPLVSRILPQERMRTISDEELDAALLVAEKLNGE